MSGYPEKSAEDRALEKAHKERFEEINRRVQEDQDKLKAKAKAATAYEKCMKKVLRILRLPEEFKYDPHVKTAAPGSPQGLGNQMSEARQELLCTLDAYGAFD